MSNQYDIKVIDGTQTVCEVCGSKEDPIVKYGRYNAVNKNLYHICECEYCHFQFVYPKPSEESLTVFYNTHSKNDYKNYVAARELKIKWASFLLDVVERFKKPFGKLLDVGCASGFAMEAAKAKGWDPYGIDISAENLMFVTEGLKCRVQCGTLSQITLSDEYQLVLMFDVLEHVPSPRETLLKIKKLLMPEGLVAFTLPCIDSFSGKFFGRSWYHYAPPAHLNYFDIKTFAMLCDDLGFEIIHHQWIKKIFTLNYLMNQIITTYLTKDKKSLSFPLIGEKNVSFGMGERLIIVKNKMLF